MAGMSGCEAVGHRLDVVDALVAAAAELMSAEIATTNIRDYPMLPGLLRRY